MAATTLKLPDREDLPYLRVGFLLCPSFTLTPMVCFVDYLRLGADASCGLKVEAAAGLNDPRDFDGSLGFRVTIMEDEVQFLAALPDRKIYHLHVDAI